jgi:hypothetical protein
MREAALYGAEVIKTTGNYDQTKELAAKFAKAKGIFLDRGIKSVAAIEAMKTMAYEIAEQLGDELEDGQRWRSPDWFLQGVSGGMGPIGVGKGFKELYDFAIVDKMPAMGIIQTSGCAPMVEAFERGQRVATPVEDIQTIIVTLATGNPGRAYELYDYVSSTAGRSSPPVTRRPSTRFASWRAMTACRLNPPPGRALPGCSRWCVVASSGRTTWLWSTAPATPRQSRRTSWGIAGSGWSIFRSWPSVSLPSPPKGWCPPSLICMARANASS